MKDRIIKPSIFRTGVNEAYCIRDQSRHLQAVVWQLDNLLAPQIDSNFFWRIACSLLATYRNGAID